MSLLASNCRDSRDQEDSFSFRSLSAISRFLIAISLVYVAVLPVSAQTTIFSDTFRNGSTLNGTSTPGGSPTASFASYDIASSKSATAGPLIGSSDLRLALDAATASGFVEA